MSKSTLALIAANVFLFGFSFIGFASVDDDALILVAMLAMAMSVVNGVAAYRRRDRAPRRAPVEDEMDARTVLDIDARLEALERREREMDEADRIRRLMDRGQQGPLADDLSGTAPVPVRERA